MKRRITLSIALLMMIVFVALTSSDSTHAQNQLKPVGGSGLIKVGTGQLLRLTVAAGDVNTDGLRVRIVRTEYAEGECGAGGACRLTVASQTTSPPIQLAAGEALAVDGNDFLVWQRITILSNRRNVKVTGIVFDTSTQRIVTFAGTTFDDESVQ